MPRDPQRPEFVRTLRVKNENRVGVLASVLTTLAQRGASVGDIRMVRSGSQHVTRDIDIVIDALDALDAVLADLRALPETEILEVRDEVLAAHAGGKLRMVAKAPIETHADLGRVYTPGVGEVCRRIFDDARAADLYTTIGNSVAIVSDGSAVLGLGNLGPAAAMPVVEGKAALLASLVGVHAIPIVLQSQQTELIVEAIAQISPTFGLVQLEDIASPRCFEIEPAVQARCDIAVFHDDQHGTAGVVLAALLSACRRAGMRLEDAAVGQIGLGAAGLAIARAIMAFSDRPVLGADRDQGALRRLQDSGGDAAETVAEVMARSDIVIATTGQAGLIPPAWVRPGQIIFALSNPRPEIDPADALAAGAAVAAGGRTVNNLLLYPGVCRGLLDVRAMTAPPEAFRAASEALVRVTPPGQLLPDALDRSVHRAVSRAVARAAIDAGVARRDLDPDYFEEGD